MTIPFNDPGGDVVPHQPEGEYNYRTRAKGSRTLGSLSNSELLQIQDKLTKPQPSIVSAGGIQVTDTTAPGPNRMIKTHPWLGRIQAEVRKRGI